MKLTLKDLNRLKTASKIRGFVIGKELPKKPVLPKSETKGDSQKNWIYNELSEFCKAHGYTLKTEVKFSGSRKFRFDYLIKELSLAVEYEGIFSAKSRHTSVKGFSTDAEKYNLAVVNGYWVLRYTAMNYHNLTNDLKCLSKRL